MYDHGVSDRAITPAEDVRMLRSVERMQDAVDVLRSPPARVTIDDSYYLDDQSPRHDIAFTIQAVETPEALVQTLDYITDRLRRSLDAAKLFANSQDSR